MTERTLPPKSVSLDDLLKANKEQFARIFTSQLQGFGLRGATTHPATQADLASAGMASGAPGVPATLRAWLDERFGAWSHEVLAHKIEGGTASVTARLRVNGAQHTEAGASHVNGDARAALQRALEEALRKCALALAKTGRPPAPAAGAPAGGAPPP